MNIEEFKSKITREEFTELDISALFKYGEENLLPDEEEWNFFLEEINSGEWGINTEIDEDDDSDVEVIEITSERSLVRIV